MLIVGHDLYVYAKLTFNGLIIGYDVLNMV